MANWKAWLGANVIGSVLAAGCTGSGGATVDLPAFDPDADVRFVLEPTYAPSQDVLVRIENVGEAPYVYRVIFPACAIQFFGDDGRQFRIPTGVACGQEGEAEIAPGETVTLFQWSLTECVRIGGGCEESQPLPAGTYSVRAQFRSADGTRTAQAGATFQIVQ